MDKPAFLALPVCLGWDLQKPGTPPAHPPKAKVARVRIHPTEHRVTRPRSNFLYCVLCSQPQPTPLLILLASKSLINLKSADPWCGGRAPSWELSATTAAGSRRELGQPLPAVVVIEEGHIGIAGRPAAGATMHSALAP